MREFQLNHCFGLRPPKEVELDPDGIELSQLLELRPTRTLDVRVATSDGVGEASAFALSLRSLLGQRS